MGSHTALSKVQSRLLVIIAVAMVVAQAVSVGHMVPAYAFFNLPPLAFAGALTLVLVNAALAAAGLLSLGDASLRKLCYIGSGFLTCLEALGNYGMAYTIAKHAMPSDFSEAFILPRPLVLRAGSLFFSGCLPVLVLLLTLLLVKSWEATHGVNQYAKAELDREQWADLTSTNGVLHR